MKGFAVLFLVVLVFIPTPSLAADIPLTPQIFDQIEAEIQAHEARTVKTEELREELIGCIAGLQIIVVAAVAVGLTPPERAILIKSLNAFKRDPTGGVEPNTIRHEAMMYTYNLMIAGLYHSLLEESGDNATSQTETP